MILLQKQQYLALPAGQCSSPETTTADSPGGLFLFSLLLLWVMSLYCCFSPFNFRHHLWTSHSSRLEFNCPHQRAHTHPRTHPSVFQIWLCRSFSEANLEFPLSDCVTVIHSWAMWYTSPCLHSFLFPQRLSSPVSCEELCFLYLVSLIFVAHSLIILVKRTIRELRGKGGRGGRFGAHVWPSVSLVHPHAWLRLRLEMIRNSCPLEFWCRCFDYLLTSRKFWFLILCVCSLWKAFRSSFNPRALKFLSGVFRCESVFICYTEYSLPFSLETQSIRI